MKLTHNCPKCNKPAKIQAEIPMGNLINYIYQCGHVELVKKEISDYQSINRLEKEQVPVIVHTLDKESIDEYFEDIVSKKTEIIEEVLVETVHNSNICSCGFGRAIMYGHEEIKVPEPTYKELYADLDEWVNEGGRVKGVNEPEIPKYIHPSYYSVDGSMRAYDFQMDGIKFAESTQLNCLIADAMGLGKTIQGIKAIVRNETITVPCLFVVKGATMFQWQDMISKWASKEFTSCMPLVTRNHIIPGFKYYIISMDMLSKKDVIEKLLGLNIKSIVIDEVQNFKDDGAKRTKGLITLIKMGNIKYKIALSGTPIKNRVGEYFTILNILAPMYFSDKAQFQREWLIPNEKRILTKLNPYKADKFKELISNWIIRRERHDVLKNLPDLTRDYQIIEIDDPAIKNSYNHTLDLFKNYLNDQGKTGINSTELLGWLAKLRAITGQAKCKNALEWTKDFLESSEESLAIGIQHHSVRDTLYIICEQFGFNPLKLSGEDNIYRKNDIVRRFTNGDNRLLIINSIAGGVGLNLQTCANALVLERQWNSADEEQFEARFHRDGQKKAVTITYMIAKNTIDEFFHDMVMNKRKILHEAGIGGSFDLDNDIDTLREFAEKVVSSKI